MNTDNSTAYSALYKYYDGLMRDYPYDRLSAFLRDAVTPLKGGRGLELATGTGRFAIDMSKLGLDMSASDISSDMLNIAIKKAETAGCKILFYFEDLNAFKPKKKLDLIVCLTDGVNYVKSLSRVDRLFCAAAASLNAGGLFIFDISTVFKAKNTLSDGVFFEDDGELAYFWRNSRFKNNKIEMSLTFFERDGGSWTRSDEESVQYFYERRDIERLLDKNGFSFECFDGKSLAAVKPSSDRLLYRATKRIL